MTLPSPSKRNAIVQMFNWRFEDIEQKLPVLHALGYSYVQISPPQKSHPGNEWWARYQPVDFTTIDGPLGDEDDLRSLCAAAAQHDMQVIADVVLNHLANHPHYIRCEGCEITYVGFPRYTREDLRGPCDYPGDPRKGWLGGHPGLPDLKTESPYVRSEARRYLRLLYDLGIRGYRFDAALHIEPDFFATALQGLEHIFAYGEFVVTHANQIDPAYYALMDAHDFPLARSMKQAFKLGGSLRLLENVERESGAIDGPAAVTFVTHHDIVTAQEEMSLFFIKDGIDQQLAMAFILMRRDGTPFIFVDDYDAPHVKAGLHFHNLALDATEQWLYRDDNCLVLQRGRRQFGIINKSGDTWHPPPIASTLKRGAYEDLLSGAACTLEERGPLGGLTVPPRSAQFWVRHED